MGFKEQYISGIIEIRTNVSNKDENMRSNRSSSFLGIINDMNLRTEVM